MKKRNLTDVQPLSAWVAEMTDAYDLSRVHADLHAYVSTANGLYLWRAYARVRRAGLPMPDEILHGLDWFSERLLAAETHDEIAAAMNMATRPGHTAQRRLRTADKALQPVQMFVRLRAFYGAGLKNEAPLIRQVASQHNMTFEALKRAVNRWERKEAERLRTPTRRRGANSVFEWGHDT